MIVKKINLEILTCTRFQLVVMRETVFEIPALCVSVCICVSIVPESHFACLMVCPSNSSSQNMGRSNGPTKPNSNFFEKKSCSRKRFDGY